MHRVDVQKDKLAAERQSCVAKKSTINPPLAPDSTLDIFQQQDTRDIKALIYPSSCDNLTTTGGTGFEVVKNRKDLICKPVDKKENLVITSRDYYNSNVLRQLSDLSMLALSTDTTIYYQYQF